MTRSSQMQQASNIQPKNCGDWLKKYSPIRGPNPSEWSGLLFPHNHPSVLALQPNSPGRIWTLLDVEGKPVVTNGMARAHRIGCFITEVEYTGPLCDFFWNDKDTLVELEIKPGFKPTSLNHPAQSLGLFIEEMYVQRCG